jgi:hypothetical protein
LWHFVTCIFYNEELLAPPPIFVFLYIYMCVCVYIYIYVYTHVHTCLHAHTHTHTNILWNYVIASDWYKIKTHNSDTHYPLNILVYSEALRNYIM